MPNMKHRDRGHFKSYYDHDDRRPERHFDGGSRRVSFKHQGGDRKSLDRRKTAIHIRSMFLQNDDIDMSGSDGRTHDKKRRHEGGGHKRLRNCPGSFYRVAVRHGFRYEKDVILKLLASHIKPAVLIPFDAKFVDKDFHFILEDHEIAEKVLQANHMITLPNGFKISLNVRPFNPVVQLNDKFIAATKVALSNRYNAAHKSLDLTRFHSDEAFISENVFCVLSRANVVSCVIELIAESVPDLVALNLNKNNISAVEHLKAIIEKLPQLRILHMAHNQIRDVKQLDSLNGLKLDEINLDGNPLAGKFKAQEDYIRAIRLRFPKVMKLDGVDLPKPITFDLEDVEVNLPKSQLSFICDVERGSGMARTFIEQYYQIFDSGDRSPLLQAYHDNAHFSILCFLKPHESHSLLSGYMSDSRNLLKMSMPEKRLNSLKIGKQEIVDALKSFPKTDHDPTTFVVDLVFFTPTLIQLIVGGLYREKTRCNQSGAQIKYFSRAFIIVPVGSGFCIVNEEFCINYPTPAQLKTMNEKTTTALPSLVHSSPGLSTAAPQPVVNGVNPDILAKQQMVTELAAKTEMNLVWSEKCLNETNWNFEQALYAFLQLQQAGKVPQEAFQK